MSLIARTKFRSLLAAAFTWLSAMLFVVTFGFGWDANGQSPEDSAEFPAELVAPETSQAWDDGGRKLIGQFCIDCHSVDFQEAELDLETGLSANEMIQHRGHWEKILQRVRFGSMPPEDAEQPSEDERAMMITAIEQVIYGSGCDLDPKPGRVTVRRLNRAEYNNTIRDIFGQDLQPAAAFPADEVGAGFDNNSDVLSLPPMLFEKYMTAAELVASKVLLTSDEVKKIDVERSSDLLFAIGERKVGSFYKFYMRADGVVWCEFDVPYTGRYRLRVDGSAGKEGEQVRLAVYNTRGEPIETFSLEYRGGGDSKGHSFSLDLEAGKQRFFVARMEPGDEPATVLQVATTLTDQEIQQAREPVGMPLSVDSNIDHSEIAFAIKRFSLEGPLSIPESLLPPRQSKLIVKNPSKKVSVSDAARPGLEWLLRRAFRSAVDRETVDQYVALVERANEREGNFERAMRVGVAAVLVSPRFLFRVELPPADTRDQQKVPLSDYQLASRLSYFLWSSTPDDELLELADQGQLSNVDVLRKQVARMLDDPRSDSLADNFAAQWLGLRNLQTVQPDTTQFTEFTPALLGDMREETRLLFLDVMRSNRSILDLLDANETYLNEPLATLYGVTGVEGNEFRKVAMTDTPRRGILTQASVLTLTSNPTRTSPVKRGKWILENVLGTPPPEPPAGVPELEQSAKSHADAPVREQLEMHRADPGCASCHRVMDALGFGFENFNAIGKYRDRDGAFPVNASGELPGGAKFSGAVELIGILRVKYGSQFAKTSTARLMTFALGRELKFEDRCVIDDIVETTANNEFRFRDLVTEVVSSPLFRFQQPEGP
jgi:hypothetical protein